MEYLVGSKEDFYDFVDGISEEDKIGIVTHTDVDGIVSGIFLQKILQSKGLKIDFIEFLNYGSGVLKEFSDKYDYDKLFFTDWKADEYISELNSLRNKGDVLVFDHHPLNEDLEDKKGIIKTESKYCSSHALFDLSNNYYDTKGLEWLACSAIVVDYTFTDERVFDFLKNVYPLVHKEDIFESNPAKNGKIIDNALIYFKPDCRKVYDLVLRGDLKSLEKFSEEVESASIEAEKEYFEKADFNPEKNSYFGYFNPRFSFVSKTVSKISHENPDKIFIMAADIPEKENFVKVSGRAQSGKVDLGEVLKKSVLGFENASAGGHPQAASATFPKKYLEEFKERVLEEL